MKTSLLLTGSLVLFSGCASQPHLADADPTPADALFEVNSDAAEAQDGFVSIFDGQTLDGWHVMPESEKGNYLPTVESFPVRDGAIHCTQIKRKGAMLLSDASYQDFELEVEVWSDWGCDSGVMLRSTASGQGIQILNDYLENGSVGFVFGQGSGGYISRPILLGEVDGRVVARDVYDAQAIDGLQFAIGAEAWNKLWVQDGWNTFKIRCVGDEPRITTWVNGELVMEFDGETYRGRGLKHEMAQNWDAKSAWNAKKIRALTGAGGSIGFQVHPGRRWAEGGAVRYRNIRIREIAR